MKKKKILKKKKKKLKYEVMTLGICWYFGVCRRSESVGGTGRARRSWQGGAERPQSRVQQWRRIQQSGGQGDVDHSHQAAVHQCSPT